MENGRNHADRNEEKTMSNQTHNMDVMAPPRTETTMDVYTVGVALNRVAYGLTRKQAARFIDALMNQAPSEKKPKVVVYRFGRFEYSRAF